MKSFVRFNIALVLLASGSLTAKVMEITSERQYNRYVTGSKKPVLVKFAADWCGVCQSVKQPFSELSEENNYKNDILFAHVDVDKADALSEKHNIVGIPTFLYVQNGTVKGQDVGVQDMDKFKDNMRGNMEKQFGVEKEGQKIDGAKSPADISSQPASGQPAQPKPAPAKPAAEKNKIISLLMLPFIKLKELIIFALRALLNLFGG